MAETFTFLPRRSLGIVLHILLILVLSAACGALIWLAFRQTGGLLLILYLFGSILLLGILPFVGYHGYALLHGVYSLKRDGLRIRWGLRAEDVPLSDVTWVRPASDLQTPLQFPPLSLPGAILGESVHPDLGTVEFIASSANCLVIVATLEKVFVLSPDLEEEFVQRFQRVIEMGTLTPMEPYSTVPAFFLRQVTSDRAARALLPLGFALTLVLLVLVSLSIPLVPLVSLGYDAAGELLAPVPSMQMLLLPVISSFIFVLSTVLGIFFYRRPESRPVSYLVWVGAVLTPLLLIAASILLLIFSL